MPPNRIVMKWRDLVQRLLEKGTIVIDRIAEHTIEWGFRDFEPNTLPAEVRQGIKDEIRQGWRNGTITYFGSATPGWWKVIP
jgi:hypothetical protein